MKGKHNMYQTEIKALKDQLYSGDLKLIHTRVYESDTSITYENVLNAFNNRSVLEEKIVKIIEVTKELIASRTPADTKAA